MPLTSGGHWGQFWGQLVQPAWELPPDAAHRCRRAKPQTRRQNRPDVRPRWPVSRGSAPIATGRAKRDPTGDLRGALLEVKTEHFAAITDPKRVGALMRVIDGYEGSLTVRCALSLAPLVFVRLDKLKSGADVIPILKAG